MSFDGRDCHLLARVCQQAAEALDDPAQAGLRHLVETVGAVFRAAAQATLAQRCLTEAGKQSLAADLADVEAITTTLHQ